VCVWLLMVAAEAGAVRFLILIKKYQQQQNKQKRH